MADSNNQPGWTEHPEISGTGMPGNKYGEAGNGRGVQQNALPEGARTASPSGNAPDIEVKPLEGNGFGYYDPRYKGEAPGGLEKPPEFTMGEVKEKWNISGFGVAKDLTNPVPEMPKIVESNALDNDKDSNPHLGGLNKKWFS